LIAYLRLRLPSNHPHRPEFGKGNAAVVRELKVLGRATPLGMLYVSSGQHKGFGASLMSEAERVVREEWQMKKLYVISAIGTRGYYYRLGYVKDGPYVSKELVPVRCT